MKKFARYSLVIAALVVALKFGLQWLPSGTAAPLAAESGKRERLLKDLGFQKYPFPLSVAEIRLKDADGREFHFADLSGKVVFLNFWASWCPDCRIEMPSMEKLHKRFQDRDFTMVTINHKEPAERVKKFFTSYKLSFASLLDPDGKIASKMAIRALPTTLIIDKQGKVIGMALGSRPWNGRKSVALFEHLTSE